MSNPVYRIFWAESGEPCTHEDNWYGTARGAERARVELTVNGEWLEVRKVKLSGYCPIARNNAEDTLRKFYR